MRSQRPKKKKKSFTSSGCRQPPPSENRRAAATSALPAEAETRNAKFSRRWLEGVVEVHCGRWTSRAKCNASCVICQFWVGQADRHSWSSYRSRSSDGFGGSRILSLIPYRVIPTRFAVAKLSKKPIITYNRGFGATTVGFGLMNRSIAYHG